MKSLGARVYLTRNLNKTLPLVGVIVLAVMLICAIVSMINSIPLSVRTIYHYSSTMMGLTPRGDAAMTAKLRKIVEEEAPVPIGRIANVRASELEVRSIVGKWQFAVIAMGTQDIQYLLDRVGMTRLEGRLPSPGAPEVIISEPISRNLNKKIGDILIGPEIDSAYSPQDVKVVGIAHTPEWLALGDIGYYRANHFPPIDALLVFTENLSDQETLDLWGLERFKGQRARVLAYHEVEKSSREMFQTLYKILDVVIGTLVVVITLMMGMLVNIHLGQRTQEFGLLQALGFTKKQLVRRVVIETLVTVVGGWILGIAVAAGMLSTVQRVLMHPNAYALEIWDEAAVRYTVPVPVAILAVALGTLLVKFRTFDPVSVVERRLV